MREEIFFRLKSWETSFKRGKFFAGFNLIYIIYFLKIKYFKCKSDCVLFVYFQYNIVSFCFEINFKVILFEINLMIFILNTLW